MEEAGCFFNSRTLFKGVNPKFQFLKFLPQEKL